MRFRLWVGAAALAITLAAPCGAKASAADGRAPMLSEELTFSAQQRQIIRKYARGRPVKPALHMVATVAQAADAAVKKLSVGVSREQVLEDLGYSPVQIQRMTAAPAALPPVA